MFTSIFKLLVAICVLCFAIYDFPYEIFGWCALLVAVLGWAVADIGGISKPVTTGTGSRPATPVSVPALPPTERVAVSDPIAPPPNVAPSKVETVVSESSVSIDASEDRRPHGETKSNESIEAKGVLDVESETETSCSSESSTDSSSDSSHESSHDSQSAPIEGDPSAELSSLVNDLETMANRGRLPLVTAISD
jgi:hypothetical protein